MYADIYTTSKKYQKWVLHKQDYANLDFNNS